MEPNEFVEFCRFVKNAGATNNEGDARVFFRATFIGYKYPSITPPYGDPVAVDGMKLGRKLAKRLK